MADQEFKANPNVSPVSPVMCGRTVVTMPPPSVGGVEGVLGMLAAALPVIMRNAADSTYLYDYVLGKQPILFREKVTRADIVNRVVYNYAAQVHDFQVAFDHGSHAQYVPEGGAGGLVGEGTGEAVAALTRLMGLAGKFDADYEVAFHNHIMGTAYLLLWEREPRFEGDAGFAFHALDPRSAFLVYDNTISRGKLLGGYFTDPGTASPQGAGGARPLLDGRSCVLFTPYERITVENGVVVGATRHQFGEVPVFEYPLRLTRKSDIETLLPNFDAINLIGSERLDALQQNVQALLVLLGCEMEKDEDGNPKPVQGKTLIELPSRGDGARPDIKAINVAVEQSQAQMMIDDHKGALGSIGFIPVSAATGDGSTSDTGAAVQYRNGWLAAYRRREQYTARFVASDRAALACVLGMLGRKGLSALTPADVGIKFENSHLDNDSSTVAAFVSLLRGGAMHPRDAFNLFAHLFDDVNGAYGRYIEWLREAGAEDAGQAAGGGE